MDVTSLNLHYRRYLVEHTPRKLPSGTYTMEVTSWNLHQDLTSLNLHHGIYLIEHSLWKLPHGTFTMDVSSWNFHGVSSTR